MKRKIAVLLVLTLLLSVVPVEVFAVSGEESNQTEATQSLPETQPADVENEPEVQSSKESDVLDEEDSNTNPAMQSGGNVQSGTCGENLTWTLTDGGTLIIFGTGAMRDYASASGAPWHAIRTSVTTIIIEDGVTSIGWYAFEHCSNMTSIMIPDSVTSIGGGAFNGCTSLDSIVVPDSVTSIGYDAFRKCTSLTTVTIGNGVTSIGTGVFYDCTSLTDVTIGNSVISIGMGAFSGCTSLTGIVIPESVKSLGHNAFNECTSLTSIDIPNSITSIGEYAFDNCTSLTDITIGNSVISIGSSAFAYCTSLASIDIPDSVTSIGRGAFEGCSGLASVEISESVTSIGQFTFYGCTSLTSIVIPEGVTNISYGAFQGCFGLTSIKIPESVTSIGEYAFDNCTSLTSIVIPDSVTSIDGGVFYGCTSLREIWFEGDAPSMGQTTFYGVTATAYYPSGNTTWTSDKLKNYYGTITWVEYDVCHHSYEISITEPTCTDQGYTTHTCHCGDSYVDNFIAALGHTPGNAVRDNEQYNGSYDSVVYCSACGVELSREYVVLPGVTVSGTATSYGSTTDDVTITLVDADGETVNSVIVTGNSAEYSFSGVTAGTYTLQISKANHVTRSYTVVVEESDVTQDAKICLRGDVTGDGKVTATDYSRLLAHVKKTSVITDAYMLLCADVTGEGKITATDYSRLLAHVKKVSRLW